MSITTISPKQLHDLVQAGEPVELIDVRTPIEFQEVHVTFARNIPLDQLDPKQLTVGRAGSQKPVYVICRSGSRGKQACEKIVAHGFSNVVNVEGGTLAWDQAELPVERGRKVMSLERQVRIAAGALGLTGAVLGYFVSPYWIGLSAFVGAGLMFAGITDTCAMGLMLARMPWNRVKPTQSSSGTTCSTPSCCR
jgi:rhodanese-related sulfurtransferase